MSELTKEWLQKTISDMEDVLNTNPNSGNDSDVVNMLAVLKIAQASLEAEPVGEFYEASPGNWYQRSEGDRAPNWTPLYTAPPAPVVHGDVRRSLEAVAKLNNDMYRWTSCMSYNGSYVGEPEGLLKRNIREIEHIMDACRADMLQGKADGKPELTVWYGAMPETNGKINWTAILHRKGQQIWEGITIDRSEYPDRVRYEADRMRHLIGELPDEPDILSYDADAHSGYVKPGNSPVTPDGWQLVPKKITLEMECALSKADSYEIGWQWALAAAPKYDAMPYKHRSEHDAVIAEFKAMPVESVVTDKKPSSAALESVKSELIKPCNCHSYNRQDGEVPNVILNVPENIRIYTDGRENVCVDACIADVISQLWQEDLPTLNSCCGHGREAPAIVIPQDAEPKKYLDMLSRIDARSWVVSRWERVEYVHTTTSSSCPKCNGSGMMGSGGVQPWGEPIEVECDCSISIPELDDVATSVEILKKRLVSCNRYNYCSDAVARVEKACRNVMLQRFENAESRCGNYKVYPDGWIPVSERMPEESGRYWCYVEEQNSLGKSHYQWNCSWNGEAWSDKALSGRVTHWMPLPEPPK
ncbi:DUF551 domain-containing protein [Citrobacter freundii]|uniref:DUF551 domain-containing protein n=1 Tax=Citrobacter freundii TaxID=546 RepID=UPI00383AB29A